MNYTEKVERYSRRNPWEIERMICGCESKINQILNSDNYYELDDPEGILERHNENLRALEEVLKTKQN